MDYNSDKIKSACVFVNDAASSVNGMNILAALSLHPLGEIALEILIAEVLRESEYAQCTRERLLDDVENARNYITEVNKSVAQAGISPFNKINQEKDNER